MSEALPIERILGGIGEAIIAAYYALEDSEQVDGEEFVRVPMHAAERLNIALTALEMWPDEPGMACGPSASAQYAIKCAIERSTGIPPEGPERDELVERMARAVAPRLWSTFDQNGDHQGVFMARAEIRHYIRAALAALIGEKG